MFLAFVRVTPFSSSSPLRHISESYCWKTVSPWCFDPVPIRSCSRSGRGSDLNTHVLTLALPDDCSSNLTLVANHGGHLMRRNAGTDAGYWTRDLGKRLFFFGS